MITDTVLRSLWCDSTGFLATNLEGMAEDINSIVERTVTAERKRIKAELAALLSDPTRSDNIVLGDMIEYIQNL